jgi:SAM-dependent methyltransferase
LGRYSLLISLTILLGEQRPRLRCVLELAAGTGIVTRRLRDLLPREARLVATDLKPPMLEVARGKFRPDETVEFQPADATALPFPPSTQAVRKSHRLDPKRKSDPPPLGAIAEEAPSAFSCPHHLRRSH